MTGPEQPLALAPLMADQLQRWLDSERGARDRSDHTIKAYQGDLLAFLSFLGRHQGGPALPATFVASEYLGSSMMSFFETGDRRVVEAEHHLSLGAPPAFEPRQPCVLTWDPDQAIVFGREGRP